MGFNLQNAKRKPTKTVWPKSLINEDSLWLFWGQKTLHRSKILSNKGCHRCIVGLLYQHWAQDKWCNTFLKEHFKPRQIRFEQAKFLMFGWPTFIIKSFKSVTDYRRCCSFHWITPCWEAYLACWPLSTLRQAIISNWLKVKYIGLNIWLVGSYKLMYFT